MSEGRVLSCFHLGHFQFKLAFVDYSLLLKSRVSFIDFKYVIFSASIIARVSNVSLIFIRWKIYAAICF